MAKHYKLQLIQPEKNVVVFKKDRDGLFLFDELDSKGSEPKAHLSTIDKFTVKYLNEAELKLAFRRRRQRNGVKLEVPTGTFIISSELLLQNDYKGNNHEEMLFGPKKIITEIPLINFSTCEVTSKAFRDFYNEFKFMCNMIPGFKDYITRHGDYPMELIKAIKTMDDREMIDFLKKYHVMRKIYSDVLSYQKRR